VFVLGAGVLALVFAGRETWTLLARSCVAVLSHLHDYSVGQEAMQGHAITGVLALVACVWPLLAATTAAGLLAGGLQSRFRTSSEGVRADWERVNPLAGFRRLWSGRSWVTTGLAVLKLSLVVALTFGVVQEVVTDPIFYSSVGVARIAGFMAEATLKILVRILFALGLIAAADYGYQIWRTNRDLMMTKEEVKEELKNTEGDPHVKAHQRRRLRSMSFRKMLADVPQADVVVTNPTHLAVALRYDRKTMRAPRVVAKGSRLNALRIRELARAHQVPVIENKPLARLLFKHARPGGEIPAQLYATVAELLAYVYRINAYRYYREQGS
jgi:flagellar biosynthetic protein FlhB